MVDLIYAESEALDYPPARRVLARFPRARVVECERYGELFNRAGQNFRLQKNHPALILAVKHGSRVLDVPPGYGVGGAHNYYFSHMLNCLYDCRYCFLQGIYRSANYVLFVNYDAFAESIREAASRHHEGSAWFFSGYDCDSLAMEPMTGFVEHFLNVFEGLPEAWLELRTKSTQTRILLDRCPLPNVVTAFSFSTEPAARTLEHRVPAIDKRIEAMATLQSCGWPIALRFDPVVWHDDFDAAFATLCRRIFARVDAGAVHSVSLGAFRLPRDFYKRMRKLYPREPLFARFLEEHGGMVGYGREAEQRLFDCAAGRLAEYVGESRVFLMQDDAA
ncbi:MAG: DNA photolyase [Proteobacteria bacterium]|nr:MAG: DNA photolyase [Pseudomonadota bacterium]